MSRILVIDDERYIREWYALELSEFGHEVITTAAKPGILKQVQTLNLDLVILDVRLADVDGLALLREIQNCHPDLSIIVCSTYPEFKDCIQFSADNYVVKSFDMRKLKEKVELMLEAKVTFLNMAV